MSTNRAFLYGDGLFETLRFQNQGIALWPYHYRRLSQGLQQLQMPLQMDADTLYFWLLQQISHPNSPQRLRLTAYRSGGGRYTPQQNKAALQLQIEDCPALPSEAVKVEGITGLAPAFLALAASPLSPFKSLNALPYVLAAQYRQSQDWVHIFLCNTEGYLAEASAYNLFWQKDNRLFTPSLASGCVAGVLRQWSIKQFKTAGYEVEEGLYPPSVLKEAEAIWLCNALQGIRYLPSWENRSLQAERPQWLHRRLVTLVEGGE